MLAIAGHRPTTHICQLNPIQSDIHTGWCPGSKLATHISRNVTTQPTHTRAVREQWRLWTGMGSMEE
jgi:hypothetical protein